MTIKRALISVSNKTGLKFAKEFQELGFVRISTRVSRDRERGREIHAAHPCKRINPSHEIPPRLLEMIIGESTLLRRLRTRFKRT